MITPEFDKEYYEKQIKFMSKRYDKIFKSWKINWNKFLKSISKSLNNNTFRIWIFLFGLEPILVQCGFKSNKKERIDFLQESSKKRIYELIKNDEKIKFFLKNI